MITLERMGNENADFDSYCLASTLNRSALIHFAYSLLHDVDLAEDAVQDALIASLSRFPDLESAPIAYIRASVKHRAYNLVRNRRAAQRFAANLTREYETMAPFLAQHACPSTDHLHAVLEQLPNRARTVAKLHWLSGYTCSEIAAELHISRKAVEKRVTYARRAVRNCLVASGYGAISDERV